MATMNSSDLRLTLLALQHILQFVPVRKRIRFRIICEHFSGLAEHALYNAIVRPKYSRYLLNVGDDGLNTSRPVERKWQALILDMVETNLHALANLTGIFVHLPVIYESAEILQQLKSVLHQLCTSNAATIVTLGWICSNFEINDLLLNHMDLRPAPVLEYRDVLQVSLSLPHLATLYLPPFKLIQSRPGGNTGNDTPKKFVEAKERRSQLWSLLEPKTQNTDEGQILPPFKNLRQLHFSDDASMVRNCLSGAMKQHVVAAFSGVELVTLPSLGMKDDLDASDNTLRGLPQILLRSLFPNAGVIMSRQIRILIQLSTPSVNGNKDSSDSEDEPNARYSFSQLVDQACCSVSTLPEQRVTLEFEASNWRYFLSKFYRLERLYAGFSNKYRHIKIVLRINDRSNVPWGFVAKLIRMCRSIRVVYEFLDTASHNARLMQRGLPPIPDDVPSIRDIPDSIATIFDARRTVLAVQPDDTLADAYYADLVKSRFGWMQIETQVIPNIWGNL